MCHFLGGGLPLAGTVGGTFTKSSGGNFSQNGNSARFNAPESFGQKNTVPINWFQNTSAGISGQAVNATGLMNNCIWLLHTSDIDKARAGTSSKGGSGYSFKARPLWSTRENESFW